MQNIKKKMYGCTEAFLADAKWILHNCIIYNGGMVYLSEVGNRLNIPPSVHDKMIRYIKKLNMSLNNRIIHLENRRNIVIIMTLTTANVYYSKQYALPLGNHKLTATAKVIVKICEHEVGVWLIMVMLEVEFQGFVHLPIMFLQMNEIEVCPECYLSACQKRDNWFCEPCVSLLTNMDVSVDDFTCLFAHLDILKYCNLVPVFHPMPAE